MTFSTLKNISAFIVLALGAAAVVSCGGGGGGGGSDDGWSAAIGHGGGTVAFPGTGIVLHVPAGAVGSGTVRFRPARVAPPAGLPAIAEAAGEAAAIHVMGGTDRFELPVRIELAYPGKKPLDESLMTVLSFNEEASVYEPATLLGHDPEADILEFETRTFDPFVAVALDSKAVPPAFRVGNGSAPEFLFGENDWSIPNQAVTLAPGGDSLGMAAFCAWFFRARPAEDLHDAFAETGTARIASGRAQSALARTWAALTHANRIVLDDEKTAGLLRALVAAFDQPQIVVMGAGSGSSHAAVLLGYDSAYFYFYDVDFPYTVPGWDQAFVPFDGLYFGEYRGFSRFAHVGLPSLGRDRDFARLLDESRAGFRSGDITVTSPAGGQTVSGDTVTVEGDLTGAAGGSDTVVVCMNGRMYPTPAFNGHFVKEDVKVAEGDNEILIVAGSSLAARNGWFEGAATACVKFTGACPKGDLLVVLDWDGNGSDLDLYVTEPEGETAWHGNMLTSSGGILLNNNRSGFGPESFMVSRAAGGSVQDGEYLIRVHCNTPGKSVSGRIVVTTRGAFPDEIFCEIPFTVGSGNPANGAPGGVGFDWSDAALVDPYEGVVHRLGKDTYFVPDDYRTIQAAIDAAEDGDTIIVSRGTYRENIDFLGKAITVKSERGADRTFIDGMQSQSVVTFRKGECADSILKGFTVTNGKAPSRGGGIFCSFSSPTISRCVVRGNTSNKGGGVYAHNHSAPRLIRTEITGNSAKDGGGVYCHNHSSPRIRGAVIGENSARDGAGIYCHNHSSPVLRNVLVIWNAASSDGGGIYCHNHASPAISNATIALNTAKDGGGLFCFNHSSPGLVDSIVWNNGTGGLSEIFAADNSNPLITYSNIEGGWPGAGNIDADPLFIQGFYLEQAAAGQSSTSPCVDAGSDTAAALKMDHLTTRTDLVEDGGVVDMGYHYPVN